MNEFDPDASVGADHVEEQAAAATVEDVRAEVAAEVRTAEQWAEARQWRGPGPLAPDYWKFSATKAFKGWPIGKELTEAEFNQAVAEMEQTAIR